MVWLDLDAAGCSKERLVEEGVKEGVRLFGGRVVVHYQICQEAVERLGRVMDAILPTQRRKKKVGGVSEGVRREAEDVMASEME